MGMLRGTRGCAILGAMGAPLHGHLTPAAIEQGLPALQELQDWLHVEAPTYLRRLPGRQTYLWPAKDPKWVVKRFEGDARADRWFDRRTGQGGRCPAHREFDNLVALGGRGLQVPGPLAWIQVGDRSLMVMEFVPHSQTLRDRLEQSPGSWRVWRNGLLDLVLDLHGRAGSPQAGHHRDLYLQHLLLTGDPERLCLIDVGRVRLKSGVRQRWFEKDLAALAHSAPDSLGERKRLAWLARYLEGLAGPVDRAQARKRLFTWARAIQNRMRRMEKHQPRHGEPTSSETPSMEE